jgi:hypothetical protein
MKPAVKVCQTQGCRINASAPRSRTGPALASNAVEFFWNLDRVPFRRLAQVRLHPRACALHLICESSVCRSLYEGF